MSKTMLLLDGWDGEVETSLDDFLDANRDGLSIEEIEEILLLDVGFATVVGGGAFATTTIERIE